MSNEFPNTNDQIKDKLEIFIKDKNCWCQGKLTGIDGEFNYQVLDYYTNTINSYNPEDVRIVIDTSLSKEAKSSNPLASYHSHLHGEYNIERFLYVPCLIKNIRGSFCSIEITHPGSNQGGFHLTKLARISEIRGNKSIYFDKLSEALNLENFSLEIPHDIKDWDKSESFTDLVINIEAEFPESLIFFTIFAKEKAVNNYSEKDSLNLHSYYLRVFSEKEHSSSIKLMLEIAIDNELRLSKFESDRISNLQKLKTVQKEINRVKKHHIDKDLVGLIIGSKGCNINRLKTNYNVSINVQSDIPGDKALITITGDDDESVQRCLNEVKLVKVSYEVNPSLENKLRNIIHDMTDRYKLYKLNFSRSKKGNYYVTYVNVVGSEENVALLVKEIKQYLNLNTVK